MAKVKSFLVLVLVLICFTCYSQQVLLRDKVQHTYYSKIGVREKTGKNDGVEVEKYLNYVWLKKGNPWCAAFVSWTMGQNGVKTARSGGCVQLLEQGMVIYSKGVAREIPQRADVFFIYFPAKGRVAHTGFVDVWGEKYVTTVEGNTNEAGSREGDGVYKKRRIPRQIAYVAKYL
jgi:hypothetical protein